MDPLIGTTIAGDFRIVRSIGTGGMGVVYLADQLSLDRPIALKILSPQAVATDAALIERFRREARAAAKIQHPNIVQVHAFGEHDGHHYIAMEYVEGETLFARLQREGRLPAKEVIRISAGVARGLSAAHKKGLIHRDVKPSNVLLGSDGATVKLSDFGLVREVGRTSTLSAMGVALGTPHYMSPEQCMGMKADGRADLYALGVTMFQLLTGSTPYDGPSPGDVMNAHVDAPVPPPEAFGPEVPMFLRFLVRSLLAKAPERRPATGDEVASALDALVSR